jgi:hypothetical protein
VLTCWPRLAWPGAEAEPRKSNDAGPGLARDLTKMG